MSNPPPPAAAATGSSSHSCKVILANTIAKVLISEIQAGLTALNHQRQHQQQLEHVPQPPHLLGILANADPAAQTYARWTEKTCHDLGFAYTLLQVEKDSVEETILAANANPLYDGIIIYYPIYGGRQDQYLQNVVSVDKDVEGLSHLYIFNMYQNVRFLENAETPSTAPARKSILPCTPLAVIKILEYLHIYNPILPYGNRLFGRTICVVNRSEVVGRPLAALLANDGACVYSVDVSGVQQFTRGEGIRKRKHEVVDKEGWTIEDCAPLCDVVITGVPGEAYKFPCHLLKEGAVCINFSSEKNFPPEVKERASIYVPAIGKVTIVVLLRNLLRVVQNRQAQLQVEQEQQSQGRDTSHGMSSPLLNAKTQTQKELLHAPTDTSATTMNGAAS
ncbi:methylenetetrahydrofolate dehydrogenase (NAD+) [Cladophialophora yegresii CBS 114405]|uniref:Methylenetetrahydrofolate dehydrogenase [NAD(+)] n=1 Tax=Cladophialophora yegresii CBS 114405 TaxID=1182544 RepID=W9VLB5_9EURO|nr:methylenetetrahydrofolate dehydrogenase (NAD+) [Cladophialophora yegresii CBS 114405]EXJ56482.1 methylenetetrahydrofolate dehydrogenase (NAD+) [Cladophialophora yegresii CBS 114405]